MPRRAMRCSVDVNIHAITCPGVWLPYRDDVFVSMRLFNQSRQTQYSSPIFPLIFHEKFCFDKVFYTAFEPSQVADALESCTVLIEVIQLSDIYDGGRLLAFYEGGARDFLYPYPTYTSTTDREVLMKRSLDFPGIAPKLEFSTRAVIKETHVSLHDYELDDVCTPRSRSRSRSRTRKLGFSQPTISSITRSRSVSPGLHRRLDALDLEDSYPPRDDSKPPFVVRKVRKELIGRSPGGVGRDCFHGNSTVVRPLSSAPRYSYDDMYWYSHRPSSRISQVVREPGTSPYPLYKYNYFSDTDAEDNEVAQLTSSPYGIYSRPRTTSPLYHSSLSDRFDDRSWSLAKSDLINSRVQRALSRNRSLERLDRLTTSPYTGTYRSGLYY